MMFFIESISYKEANRYLFWNNVSINDVLPLPGTKIPISISELPSKLHLTTSEVVNIIYLLEKKYIHSFLRSPIEDAAHGTRPKGA